jgi:hypothetical protein
MHVGRLAKSLAMAMLCVLIVPLSARADAVNGAIFAQATTIQTNTRLVLGFAGGGTFTLNTTDSEIQNCAAPANCVDTGGNAVAKSPNQGAWASTDAGNFTGNSVYVAGTTNDGFNTYTFRDFWSFDLAKYKEYLALNPGAVLESATLEVQRYGAAGMDDYVGIRFNPLTGNDANGNPITAQELTNLSAFDSHYFTGLGGPSDGTAGLYGTYKVWNTDPSADPNDILLFNLSGGTSPLIADLLAGLNNVGANGDPYYFTIGGSTFDASSTDGVPIVPTGGSVPEPASLILIGTGLAGFVSRCRK